MSGSNMPEFGEARAQAWASPKIERCDGEIGQGVVAREEIEPGEVLIALAHVFTAEPSRYTIQLEEGLHQAGTGEIDDFLNHACEPSVRLDAERRCFVAARRIAPGEELTFNYLSSEWDMAEPFECRCGSRRCLRKIRGFRHLTPEQQRELDALLTPHLRRRAWASLPSAA